MAAWFRPWLAMKPIPQKESSRNCADSRLAGTQFALAETAKKFSAGSGSRGRAVSSAGAILSERWPQGAAGEKLFGNFPDYTQLPDEVMAKAAMQKAGAK